MGADIIKFGLIIGALLLPTNVFNFFHYMNSEIKGRNYAAFADRLQRRE